MNAAKVAKKAALQSQGYYDDETLAQKSMSVISAFDNEQEAIVAKFRSVSSSVNRVIFRAALMVRVESPLPDEIKHSKQRIHSIGSGFFIFEKQTLVAYSEKYDGKAITDLRPMKEDYYFSDPSIPFKEIRWYVDAEAYRFMRGVRFSVLAFPWGSRREAAKKEQYDMLMRKKPSVAPAEQRRIVEALVEAHPSIVGAKSKIATLTKDSIDIERKVTVKQGEKIKLESQIDRLLSQRDSFPAIKRVVLDKQVRDLRAKVAVIAAEISELSERSKQLRSGVGQLNKTIADTRAASHEKYLRRARMLVSSGKSFTADEFQAAMMKRVEKTQENTSS